MSYKKLIIVDDDPFVAEMWKSKLDTYFQSVEIYLDPKYFFEKYRLEDLPNIKEALIITDYYFSKDSEYHGGRFSKLLRHRGYEGDIALLSDTKVFDSDLLKHIDFYFDKLFIGKVNL